VVDGALPGEFGSAIQKLAPIDTAMHVSVEKTEWLRVEITGFFLSMRLPPKV